MERKILFISALKKELLTAKKNFVQTATSQNIFFFEEIGIGLINSLYNFQNIIIKLTPDLIIYSGICGALTSELNIGDILLPNKCLLYENGYYFGENNFSFENTVKYSDLYCNENSVLNYFKKINIRSCNIASGNSAVFSKQKRCEIKNALNADIIDMESFSVAFLCNKYKIKLVTIKSVSDTIDDNLAEKISSKKYFIKKENIEKSLFSIEEFFKKYFSILLNKI